MRWSGSPTLNIFQTVYIASTDGVDGAHKIIHVGMGSWESLVKCSIEALKRIVCAINDFIAHLGIVVPKRRRILNHPSILEVRPKRFQLSFKTRRPESSFEKRNSVRNNIFDGNDC